MRPLTEAEIRERTVALFERLIRLPDVAEDVLFEIVRCDSCETTINLLLEEPVGWMTSGSPETGYRDLCPACQ